jgi:hypothetical protein
MPGAPNPKAVLLDPVSSSDPSTGTQQQDKFQGAAIVLPRCCQRTKQTSTMNEQSDAPSDGQLQVLRELVEEGASIDGDVLEVAKDTWVVHGFVGYDGEIPMAVFDTYDGAKHVLEQVPRAPRYALPDASR